MKKRCVAELLQIRSSARLSRKRSGGFPERRIKREAPSHHSAVPLPTSRSRLDRPVSRVHDARAAPEASCASLRPVPARQSLTLHTGPTVGRRPAWGTRHIQRRIHPPWCDQLHVSAGPAPAVRGHLAGGLQEQLISTPGNQRAGSAAPFGAPVAARSRCCCPHRRLTSGVGGRDT